jgi:hypothetical protein
MKRRNLQHNCQRYQYKNGLGVLDVAEYENRLIACMWKKPDVR